MKSIEQFYNYSFGDYAGFYIREKRMKKLAKIINRQERELKEFLAADLDALEIAYWTLAYPKNKQTSVRFFKPSTDEEKLRRLEVSKKVNHITHLPDVFIADSMDDAEEKYMEWWNSENEEKED